MTVFLPCRVGREKIEEHIDRGAQQTQVFKRKLRLRRQREARGTLLRHPFRNPGDRAIGLRNDDEIDATVGESPENGHHFSASRMERIPDPSLNLLLAGSMLMFRVKLESRGCPHLDRAGELQTSAEARAVSRAF
jgi:hypothetical protein